MKFKVLDDYTIETLISFLDDIQIRAIESNEKDIVQFCQSIITELINADEIYDDDPSNTKNSKDIDYIDIDYDDYLKNIYNYLTQISDSFTDNPDGKKSNKNKKRKSKIIKVRYKNILDIDLSDMSMNEIIGMLRVNTDLTNNEKFELYYNEYRKRNKTSFTLGQVLKNANIKKSSDIKRK